MWWLLQIIMDNQSTKSWLILLIIIALIWIWRNYKTIDELEYTITEYQSALEEANNNIEEANSTIEDAQGYTWSSYEDMGYALDNLETVETVSEP